MNQFVNAGIRTPWDDPPEEGAAIEVAEGILWMRLPLPMKLDHVNVYAVDEGDSWTVIDTGFLSNRGIGIWQDLLAGPLAGKPVSRVLVTHHHPDHIGMAGWFMARGAELLIPATAYFMARMLVLDEQERSPPETLAFYARNGIDPDLLEQRAKERPFNFADMVAPLPLGFTRLDQDDRITLGGRSWDVHLGQGHAPDHATLWCADAPIVLGGDQLLPSISPNIGVYATEPEADPLKGWLESCARFAKLATEDQLVLGGHKLPYLGLPLRLRQLADNHVHALERLEAHLSEPRRGGECFPPLFKRQIGEAEYGLAFVETIAHLNHLHQAGRARRWMADDGVYRWQAV